MFIHIGNDLSVLKSSVTCVVNLETVSPSQKDVTEFINREDEQGRLQYVTEEIPKEDPELKKQAEEIYKLIT